MNQTLALQPTLHSTPQQEPQPGWDILSLLRIVFYIIITVKLIELSFLRKKKATLKERIHRKFLFTHQEVMKNFTDEDKSEMEITLANTLKNAASMPSTRQSRRITAKKVQFCVEKNSYHQPIGTVDSDDQDEYLDIEQQKDCFSFQQKKQGDEFVQRADLLGLEENTTEETLNDSSKLTQSTQSSTSDVNDSDIKDHAHNEEKIFAPIPENSNESQE